MAGGTLAVKIFGLVGGLTLLLAGLAFGQAATEAEAVAEIFSREPASVSVLKQNDVDAYLEAVPLLKQPGADRGQVTAVFEKAGWSEVRGLYVVIRVAQAYAVLEFEKELGAEAAESYRESLDEPLRPSPEEVALVRQNKHKLDAAMAAW